MTTPWLLGLLERWMMHNCNEYCYVKVGVARNRMGLADSIMVEHLLKHVRGIPLAEV